MHIPTYHTCNSPCELTVYRLVPLNNPALFLALAEILFLAVTNAVSLFALTKVGAFVFIFSLLSSIGQ